MGSRLILCHKHHMIRSATALAVLVFAAACATSVPYGPAEKEGGKGYAVQPIESNRFRVSYTDTKPELARTNALRRAAEVTKEQSADWFEIVGAYDDSSTQSGRSGSSISIGGGTSSGGSSRVGLGVGFGIPIGGSSGPATHVLEIITGSGDKPDGERVYLADDVLLNLATQ